MGKRDKAGDDSPADLLDIRGLPREEQVQALADQYRKAYQIWSSFPEGIIDPRLIENFKVLSETLERYLK